MQQSYVGVDISKDNLDIAGLKDASFTTIPNMAKANLSGLFCGTGSAAK